SRPRLGEQGPCALDLVRVRGRDRREQEEQNRAWRLFGRAPEARPARTGPSQKRLPIRFDQRNRVRARDAGVQAVATYEDLPGVVERDQRPSSIAGQKLAHVVPSVLEGPLPRRSVLQEGV